MALQTQKGQAIKKPKVLIAAGIYPPDPGGPAIHASKQFEYFKQEGLIVDVVALAHFRRWPVGIRHLLYFCALIVKGIGKDVIYAHDALGVGWPAYIAAKILGRKIIVRIGGDIPWEREAESGRTDRSLKEWYGSKLYRQSRAFKLSSRLLKRFDVVIVPTQLLVDLYRNYYEVDIHKIHLVSNPVPEGHKTVAAAERKIIYASRLVAYKNLDFVIRSLGDVFKKYPDVIFEIMGDGPERDNLEKQVRESELEGRVVLKGKVSQTEVMKETQDCLLGLAPALTEFNPNYILQCIAYGKPFLMSRENGLPITIPEEFLFDARDAKQFEAKLDHLLSPAGYQMGQVAVASLNFSMSWEINLSKNLEIISSLL
jgi:glycosyltransferase involved in cell wall biosynthesis